MSTNLRSTAVLIMLGALIWPFACAPTVGPPPKTVRRIAILPPCDATGAPLSERSASVGTYGAAVESLGKVLESAARDEIARHGFQVLAPGLVEAATGGRVPASPEMAAEIIASAKLDATALFMRARRWEFAYPTLRTNEIIASVEVMLVDPTVSKIVWEVRRPPKPVQLHGELIGSQADVVAAQEVMRELFASLGQRSSAGQAGRYTQRIDGVISHALRRRSGSLTQGPPTEVLRVSRPLERAGRAAEP